jgi:hypothetical protein
MESTAGENMGKIVLIFNLRGLKERSVVFSHVNDVCIFEVSGRENLRR